MTTRAFTLIEAVLVVLVLAVTVPAGMRMIRSSERSQQEAERVLAATTIASSVAEQIVADVEAIERFGPGAFDDKATYLNDPTDGLLARTAWLLDSPTTQDMSLEIVIGEPDQVPAPAGFRAITITVVIPSLWQGERRMPLQLLVRASS